jgi:molecular chaperone HscB
MKQCTNPECADKPALPLPALNCPSCSSLQPIPSEIDYYDLLNPSSSSSSSSDLSLEQRWHISESELKATWRRTMALTHPDRMSGKSERERGIAEQQSSLVNKAYETLRKPLNRAVYLVSLPRAYSFAQKNHLADN